MKKLIPLPALVALSPCSYLSNSSLFWKARECRIIGGLLYLNYSRDNIMGVKSRRMKLTGNVARVMENYVWFWSNRRHLQDMSLNGRRLTYWNNVIKFSVIKGRDTWRKWPHPDWEWDTT